MHFPVSYKNHIIICSDKNIYAKKAEIVLRNEGINKIYILKGGIHSWTNAGFPLIKTKIKKLINK